MPRPKNKSELLALSRENFEKLLVWIEENRTFSETGVFPEQYLNRNVVDVLCHLHHWHILMVGWYEVGMAGDKPKMPAEGYTWKTLPAFNRNIQKKYNAVSLDDAKEMVEQSFMQVQDVIEKHSNSELFTKKKYPWTGSTSLGSYLVSATSSHYDWAIKICKKSAKKAQFG